MTTAELETLVNEGKNMTNEQSMSIIKLSNYEKKVGFHKVIVKRNNILKVIHAFHLDMYENTYTIDGRLIANRIE